MATILSFLPFIKITPTSHAIVTDSPIFTTILLALGTLSLLKFIAKTAGVLLQTFVLPGKSLKKYGAGKGAWAIVTGASEGIGREFALQFAKKGFNVMVLARNKIALDALAAEIESNSKVQTKVLQLDFSKVDDNPQWMAFYDAIKDLDIGVLVNNCARSHAYPTDFIDAPVDEVDSILAININALLKVTRAVLPGMILRKRGLILGLASFAGVSIPSPMLAPYAASKAFLSAFNAALGPEVKSKGIDVETVNTYFVVSNMSKIRKPNMMIPTPKQYVRAVLSKIGLPCGALFTGRPYVSTPYWSHSLYDYVIQLIGWKAITSQVTHNMHKDIRKRALRKLEREAKKQ